MSTFTGNINLLVAAPMLQDALIDKDGTPMAGGTITCSHDNSRTTLKNWYYQSGTPGNYTYITLPNPLTLSAAGTICDINGVDTIPFFYPYDEDDEDETDPYYIAIINYAQTNQITRANFPFIGNADNVLTTVNSFNNLVINGSFWRNIQPNTVNVTPYTSVSLNGIMAVMPGGTNYSAIVAPSQHDAFRMPDIQFQKNNLSATDVVTFTPFPLGFGQPVTNSIVPEYYLNHICTLSGSSESQKCYQFPISLHINTLDNVPFTFSIEGQNAGGSSTGQNVLSIFILQDPGTGGTGGVLNEIGQITLNSSWQTYTISSIFPDTTGVNLGDGSDDALYILVQLPLNTLCEINFTKPSIYLTNNIVPNNDFQTYDQIDSIINTPRTGDIRISLNSFSPYGWVTANDGTIGTAASLATTRANADTWPLYNLLWNNVSDLYAPVTGGRGGSAYADFSGNKPIQLTQTLGRALASIGQGPGPAVWTLGQTTGTQTHSIILSEIPNHTHNPGSSGTQFWENSSTLGFAQSGTGVNGSGSNTTGNITGYGAQTALSLMQPTVFYNVFIKL